MPDQRPNPTDVLIDPAPAAEHVRTLLGAHTMREIAIATNLTEDYLNRLAKGTGPKRMRTSTSEIIMTAEPEKIAVEPPFVLPEKTTVFHQRVLSLAALGYPLAWQAKMINRTEDVLIGALTDQAKCHSRIRDKVRALYADYQDYPAKNRLGDGLPLKDIVAAKRLAATMGFRTPDHYDDKGRPIPARERRLLNRYATRQVQADLRIDVLRDVVKGYRPDVIGERNGIDTKFVTDYLREAGLRYWVNIFGNFEPCFDSRARAREVTKILNQHLADPDADAFRTVRRLGMMSASKWDIEQDDTRSNYAKAA